MYHVCAASGVAAEMKSRSPFVTAVVLILMVAAWVIPMIGQVAAPTVGSTHA